MKLILLVVGAHVASSTIIKASQAAVERSCLSNAQQFITTPLDKHSAVEHAMDHCALDKKVDDKNFVCPHYKEVLHEAFARKDTSTKYDAKAFCEVAELYVSQLQDAARVPNMGKGHGFNFVLSKDCEGSALASFGKGKKSIPARTAPDFWYALCMNQDCAHFLPSRTRWCKKDHAPAHSASVCESVRSYATSEKFQMEHNLNKDLNAKQVCSIYDDYVEHTHINVEAYMHVVHGTKDHPVPSPANRQRALESAKMKNEADKNKLRDAGGQPVKTVKSAAATSNAFLAFVSLAGLLVGRQ